MVLPTVGAFWSSLISTETYVAGQGNLDVYTFHLPSSWHPILYMHTTEAHWLTM